MRAKLMVTVLVLAVAVAALGQAATEEREITSGRMSVVGEEGVLGDLPLEHTDVEIDVSGNLQRATVRQVYGNPYDEVIEAVYVFPLPQSGAVDRMDMWIGDRLVHGEIHERSLAREIYEEAISSGQTASLLEQERPNIFTQSVGNILPGDSIVIEISYVAPVEYDDGQYELVFPMVVGPRFMPPGGHEAEVFGGDTIMTSVPDAGRITPPVVPEGTRSGYDIDLSVRLRTGVPVRDMEVLNHDVDIDLDWDGTVNVALENDDEIPNRDFVLRYRTAGDEIESGVLAHNGRLGGHFMLILQPDADVPVDEITPKELFFVVDCSGSMSGQPMEVAKETVRQFVAGMNPHDTFQIMRFSETASSMSREPLPNTEENVEQGIRYINAMSGGGGTMMIEGVRAAIGYPEDPERMRFVIFLTDGFIGNEAEILGELQRTLGERTRLFSIGVGSSPNRYLIEGLAEEGRGHAYYVGLNEEPDVAVGSIYEKINNPYLVGIDIDWGDLQVTDVYPSRIPDLFAGQPLVISGRYEGGGTDEITVSGSIAGRSWSQSMNVTLPEEEPDHDVVATLWARRKIHDLSRQLYDEWGYVQNDPVIVNEITDTALDYQIMSQYTSFVAVSEEVRTDPDGNPITVDVPVNMPEGVSYEGVFGSSGEDRGASLAYTTANRSMGMGGGAAQPVAPAPGSGVMPLMEAEESIDDDFLYDGTGTEWTPDYYGQVSMVSVTPTLGMLPSEARGAVREIMDQLQEVYDSYVEDIEEADDWPVGTYTFAVTVDDTGSVTSVTVVDSALDRELAAEMEAVLEGLSLPAPPDGGGTMNVRIGLQKLY